MDTGYGTTGLRDHGLRDDGLRDYSPRTTEGIVSRVMRQTPDPVPARLDNRERPLQPVERLLSQQAFELGVHGLDRRWRDA